jgi:hypothetical protein
MFKQKYLQLQSLAKNLDKTPMTFIVIDSATWGGVVSM